MSISFLLLSIVPRWSSPKKAIPCLYFKCSIPALKGYGLIEQLGPFGVLIHVLHLEPRVDPLPELGQ